MKVIWCKHSRLTFYNGGDIVTGCDVCERKTTVRKFLRSEYEKIKETGLSAEAQALKHVREVIASGDPKAVKWMLAQLAVMSEMVKEVA